MRVLMIFLVVVSNLSCNLMKGSAERETVLSKGQLAKIAFLTSLQYYENISIFDDSIAYPINLSIQPASYLDSYFNVYLSCVSLKLNETEKLYTASKESFNLDTITCFPLRESDICPVVICKDSFDPTSNSTIYVSNLYSKDDFFFLITSIPGQDKFGTNGIYHIYIELNRYGVVLEQCYNMSIDPN